MSMNGLMGARAAIGRAAARAKASNAAGKTHSSGAVSAKVSTKQGESVWHGKIVRVKEW